MDCLNSHVVSSPSPGDERTEYFSTADSLPAFALLTSDEERERKAEASSPGTYHVIVVPDSFSTLPEYADEIDKARPYSGPESNASTTNSPTRSNFEPNAGEDHNTVILRKFEDVARRSSSTGRTSRVSPTSEISDPFCSLSLSPILDAFPSSIAIEDDHSSYLDAGLDQAPQDSTLFAHFRHVVWKQLFPHDRGMDDSPGMNGHGMTLSVDFLEREAARFPPVCHFTRFDQRMAV